MRCFLLSVVADSEVFLSHFSVVFSFICILTIRYQPSNEKKYRIFIYTLHSCFAFISWTMFILSAG